jgi:chitinase
MYYLERRCPSLTSTSYWAGWSLTTRSCAKRTIDDVPVGSLTHLNLAFAYIEPETFEIVPMPRTSDDIFSQMTNLKQKAPGLKVWISLGGWTYSDNGTDTQAVWGDLSRTSANRYKFAANLHKFMKTWGFDGVDLVSQPRRHLKDEFSNRIKRIGSIRVHQVCRIHLFHL